MTTLTYDALLRVQRTVLAHYCGCSGETQRAAGSTLNPTRPDVAIQLGNSGFQAAEVCDWTWAVTAFN